MNSPSLPTQSSVLTDTHVCTRTHVCRCRHKHEDSYTTGHIFCWWNQHRSTGVSARISTGDTFQAARQPAKHIWSECHLFLVTQFSSAYEIYYKVSLESNKHRNLLGTRKRLPSPFFHLSFPSSSPAAQSVWGDITDPTSLELPGINGEP